jgi:hypothetical protein
MMTKSQMDRLAQKYHRLAYELQRDRDRVRTSWHPSYGDTIHVISVELAKLAQAIEAEIT